MILIIIITHATQWQTRFLTTITVTNVPSSDIKRLFLAYRRELQSYLTRKVRDAEIAADLTQETFLRFTEHHQGGNAATVLHERSYLYRVAHNLAVDHVRQQHRSPVESCPDEVLAELPFDYPSPEQETAGHRDLQAVRRALLELPERTRQIFVLIRIEGHPYRMVAERLGVSESAVQKHLARAIQHVMERMRPVRGAEK